MRTVAVAAAVLGLGIAIPLLFLNAVLTSISKQITSLVRAFRFWRTLDVRIAREDEPLPAPAAKPPSKERKAAAARKRSWKEQQEHAALPEKIAAHEAEAAELDRRFADPALYAGPRAQLERLKERRAELGTRIAALYRRWEELE